MMLTNIFRVSRGSSICLCPSVVSVSILGAARRRGSLSALPAHPPQPALPARASLPAASLLARSPRDNQARALPSICPSWTGTFAQAALGMAAGLSDPLPLVPRVQTLLTSTGGSYFIDLT